MRSQFFERSKGLAAQCLPVIGGSRNERGSELFSIAVAVIILLVDLWAIVSVFRSNKSVGVKAAWAIGLIVFPVLGLIVWGIAGPRGIKEGPSSPEHSKG